MFWNSINIAETRLKTPPSSPLALVQIKQKASKKSKNFAISSHHPYCWHHAFGNFTILNSIHRWNTFFFFVEAILPNAQLMLLHTLINFRRTKIDGNKLQSSSINQCDGKNLSHVNMHNEHEHVWRYALMFFQL